MVGGRTQRGTNHVVIVRDGQIVHDPHPEGRGIVAPAPDGQFYVMFIARLL